MTRDGRSFDDLPSGARVGTSSARREAFLRAIRPDLVYLPIRGNVETRYHKLRDGQYDAIILAMAGLERLGLSVPLVPFDPSVLPPAPGQGALAIQVRDEAPGTRALLEALHHPPTGYAVAAERYAMAALEGGCRLPVAALGTPVLWVRSHGTAAPHDEHAERVGSASADDQRSEEGHLHLLVAVAAADGSRVLRATGIGPIDRPEALAESIVRRLRDQGADTLTRGQLESMSV